MWPNIIIAAWASAAFTIYWLDFFRGPKKFPFLDFKPINCECCLSVWMFALSYIASCYHLQAVAIVAAAFSTGIITPLLLKAIRK